MEVLLYNYVWPQKQSGYISGMCEIEQKDVLYIVFQERATPASMQATSSAKYKKKKHRQIDEFNSLLFTDFTDKKKEFSLVNSLPKIRRALLQTSKSSILLTKPLRPQLSNRTLDLRIRLSHRHNSTSMPSR